MSQSMLFILLGGLILCLVPLVPKMMRLRIRFLRFLRWNWLANQHQKHFNGLVVAVRIIMLTIATILLVLGFGDGSV